MVQKKKKKNLKNILNLSGIITYDYNNKILLTTNVYLLNNE